MKSCKEGPAFSFLCWHRSEHLCIPQTTLHLLHFHLRANDACVFSGLLMFVWSVWYVNEMLMHRTNQPSATWRRGWRLSMSHVTSVRACQSCLSSSDAKPLICVEKLDEIHPAFSFFIPSLYLAEDSVSCENPGLPDNGYQILSKRLYLPGESLTFVCYQGYELIGEVAIKCILGNPSFWSGPLPLCRGENFAGLVFF